MLRSLGFSVRKATTFIQIATAVVAGDLDLDGHAEAGHTRRLPVNAVADSIRSTGTVAGSPSPA
jgi:hypothetical protein